MRVAFLALLFLFFQSPVVNANPTLRDIKVIGPVPFYAKLYETKVNPKVKRYRDTPKNTSPQRWFIWDGSKFIHTYTWYGDRPTTKHLPPKGKPPTFLIRGKRVISNLYMNGKWGYSFTKP